MQAFLAPVHVVAVVVAMRNRLHLVQYGELTGVVGGGGRRGNGFRLEGSRIAGFVVFGGSGPLGTPNTLFSALARHLQM